MGIQKPVSISEKYILTHLEPQSPVLGTKCLKFDWFVPTRKGRTCSPKNVVLSPKRVGFRGDVKSE